MGQQSLFRQYFRNRKKPKKQLKYLWFHAAIRVGPIRWCSVQCGNQDIDFLLEGASTENHAIVFALHWKRTMPQGSPYLSERRLRFIDEGIRPLMNTHPSYYFSWSWKLTQAKTRSGGTRVMLWPLTFTIQRLPSFWRGLNEFIEGAICFEPVYELFLDNMAFQF